MRRTMAMMVAVLVVIGVGWWSWTGRSEELEAGALRYDLRPGQRLTYALDYEGREQVTLPGAGEALDAGTLDVRTRIEATVEVTVLRRQKDHWLLSWRIAELRHAELGLGESSALEGGQAQARELLQGHEALIELGFDGAVQRVLLEPGDPEPFRTLAKLLVAETQLRLGPPGATEWERTEDVGLGAVATEVAVTRVEEEAVVLGVERGRYSRLLGLPWVEDLGELEQEHEHRGQVRFDGKIGGLRSSERLVVRRGDQVLLDSEATLSWRLLAIDRVEGDRELDEVIARREAYRLDEVPRSPTAEADMLSTQAGTMTFARIAARLRGFDAARLSTAEHDRFLWEATGLLALHPELCEGLVPLFGDDEVTDDGRYLALDVLTIVGHGTAQSVLRKLLSSERALSDDAVHARMLQRLSRVEAPDAETARFVLSMYDEATREHERIGAALTMGSVVRKLPAGSTEQELLYQRMVDDLGRAADPETQATLLRGLSNAGQQGNVLVALDHADAVDPRVRAAAALSLQKVPGGDASAVLGELVGDADARVQTTALQVLGERELDQSVREAVGEEILGGGLRPQSYWAAYQLVRGFPAGQQRRELAVTMARQAPDDPRLRSKLATLAQAEAR